jgi:hypothetical protein
LLAAGVPELGARSDVAERPLRLVACEHTVCEFEGLWARECSIHEALQLPTCDELGGDAFDDTVAGE